LQRIYGTAFPTKDELAQHLARLEEAKKRDHRVIGKDLGLFHIDEQVGQGLVLWKPNGAIIRQELGGVYYRATQPAGIFPSLHPSYRQARSLPYIRTLPLLSGLAVPTDYSSRVLDELAEEGCTCSDLSNKLEKGEIDGYLLKPMNCPMHIRIFKSEQRSYRDLPVRLAEFGTVYRWEQSGELNGMTRVRGFTQDDAHLLSAKTNCRMRYRAA
jgi:threonyl-tRNA synthetase